MIIAALEAGGTKFTCGLFEADCSDNAKPALVASQSFKTTMPEETLAAARDFLAQGAHGKGAPDCLGIGCFGPADLKPSSPTWGHVTATPKPGWRDTDIAGYFRDSLGVPVAFDTDVNAAAYGEFLWGAARGLKDFVYLTVGTGIGGGVFSNGSLVHGLTHPELGHVKVARQAGDDFPGCCPFHADCVEGLASGPAIGGRWKAKPEELPPEHPAWELEARYLARAIAAYSFVLSPERVLVGGGVGMRPGLVERVATLLGEELGGYLPALASQERLESFVRRPALGAQAGLFGSAALALRFCEG